MRKFNKLHVPDQWNNYFTRYPQGYTILESLLNWVTQVDDMVENQNALNKTVADYRVELDDFVERFDPRLQEEVTKTLSEWQDSGFLDVVISEALQTQITTVSQELAQAENEIDVIKTKNVSVESFPRQEGESDDTNRIMRAYATLNEGDTFIIPKDYYITNLVFDKDRIMFSGNGTLIQLTTASGVAVTLGKETPSYNIRGNLDVQKQTRNWLQYSVGIKLLNTNEALLTVKISDFQQNFVVEGDANGCSYNNITINLLKNGQKNLVFNAVNSGWVNENSFYGGRFQWASHIDDVDKHHIYIPVNTMNNNSFYSPSLEGNMNGTLIYCNGQYNHFYSPRLEANATVIKIEFGLNSLYNQLIYPYAHTDVFTDENYINKGTRNHIFSRDDIQFNHSIVRASAFYGHGNPKQNSAWGNGAVFEGQSTSSTQDKIFSGKNSGGTETFFVNGAGDVNARVFRLTGGERSITNNGTLYGDHWSLVDDAYNTRSVKIAAIKNTAGAPFGSQAQQGTAVLNTVEEKLYFHLGEGIWKGIELT